MWSIGENIFKKYVFYHIVIRVEGVFLKWVETLHSFSLRNRYIRVYTARESHFNLITHKN